MKDKQVYIKASVIKEPASKPKYLKGSRSGTFSYRVEYEKSVNYSSGLQYELAHNSLGPLMVALLRG